MVITFVGHSLVSAQDKIKQEVKEQIKANMLKTEQAVFYNGVYGDFDNVCAIACKELKKENNKPRKFRNIKAFSLKAFLLFNINPLCKIGNAGGEPSTLKAPFKALVCEFKGSFGHCQGNCFFLVGLKADL